MSRPGAGRPTSQNVIANFVGQFWLGILSLAFVPTYVRYLGIESYGLVGLFTTLQSSLSLLDVGLAPTLTREMARYTGGAYTPQALRDLLRTVEGIYLAIALSICAGVLLLSEPLAQSWLRLQALPVGVVAQAIAMMGFVVAARFFENLYRSVLYGLQEQVWFNAANCVLVTLRTGGAVLVLAFVSPTITAFFLWQGFSSLLSVAVFAFHTYRAIPPAERPAKPSLSTLRGKIGFAAYTLVNTLLAILLTQVDKILLSRYLALTAFGYYTLASSLAAALYMLVTPLTIAMYPRLTELHTRGQEEGAIQLYHQSSQLAAALVMPVGLTIIAFAPETILAWSGNPVLVRELPPILVPLILGNMLNALMYMPLRLQLAYGRPELVVHMNVVAVAILVPAIFLVLPSYGAVGAAWIWCALNVAYLVAGIQYMHARMMKGEKWNWWLHDTALPAVAIAMAVAGCSLLGHADSRWGALWRLCLTGMVAMIAAALAARHVRNMAIGAMDWLLLKGRKFL